MPENRYHWLALVQSRPRVKRSHSQRSRLYRRYWRTTANRHTHGFPQTYRPSPSSRRVTVLIASQLAVNRPLIYDRFPNMRDEMASLVIPSAGASFTGTDFRTMMLPGVYLYLCHGLPLYVGSSRNCLTRSSCTNHAQSLSARAQADEVRLFPCRSLKAARVLERLLIARLQPAFNDRQKHSRASKRMRIERLHLR